MGQKIWVAFECGALAEYADKPEESRRLYNLGYDQGKTLRELKCSVTASSATV
jgi:hypothetical protein